MKESHGSRFETGSYAFTKAESLLEMIVNFDGFHPDPIQEKKVVPIPPVKQDHITPLPGTPSFLVLTSSFCGSGKRLPSCQEESAGFDLTTPLGRLRVEGNNEHENFFLRHYLVNGLGSEGLKDLVALIDVYRMLSFNHAQAQNIEISTKQLLQRLGKGQHAADRGEQLRLISTALYLSRATVTHISSQPVQIPPVLVLEGIQTDNRGNIWLSYHLSEEIFNAIYEHKSPLYVVPASRIVEYLMYNQKSSPLRPFSDAASRAGTPSVPPRVKARPCGCSASLRSLDAGWCVKPGPHRRGRGRGAAADG